MKLSSRTKLLSEADIELFNIRETIKSKSNLSEDVEFDRKIRDFENQIQKLKIRAKQYEKEMSLEAIKNQKVMSEFKKKKIKKRHANPVGGKPEDDSWRNEPVYSKYALANLPPTDDPEELEKRRRMETWQIVNKKLIDSWWDYINTRSWKEDFYINREGPIPLMYNKNGKPIMSTINKNKIMDLDEWQRIRELKIEKSRGGMENFIVNFLKDLAFWMSP